MMYFKELWITAVGIFTIVCIGFLAIVGVISAIHYADCRGFASGTGKEVRWSFGCYVKVGDEWVPKSYVYGTAVEARIKK